MTKFVGTSLAIMPRKSNLTLLSTRHQALILTVGITKRFLGLDRMLGPPNGSRGTFELRFRNTTTKKDPCSLIATTILAPAWNAPPNTLRAHEAGNLRPEEARKPQIIAK